MADGAAALGANVTGSVGVGASCTGAGCQPAGIDSNGNFITPPSPTGGGVFLPNDDTDAVVDQSLDRLQRDLAQVEYDRSFESPPDNLFAGPGASPPPPRLGNLDQANPVFRTRVDRTLNRLEQLGYQPRVASGVRTLSEQRALVRAENSLTVDSAHVWGFGADIVDRRWGWNVPAGRTYWQDLMGAAQAEGLVSGGAWKRFPDPAHVEMPNWRNLR